ncbi:hypothetical protein COLO4_28213 [Corchorus olitorius]|uniref:Uncharacterized protein n=1 Tax=Corchorus olitorius TaxID=93759 RepID=A0A1R3HMB5_9ROSI|nr:hypothetical protein COLO4_28213 [Corchorus olitorius]
MGNFASKFTHSYPRLRSFHNARYYLTTLFPSQSQRDVNFMAFPFSHLSNISSWSLHHLYHFNCYSKLPPSKGNTGHIWTISGAHLDGTFALTSVKMDFSLGRHCAWHGPCPACNYCSWLEHIAASVRYNLRPHGYMPLVFESHL